MKILVGMSGGVDSSVAALLMKKAGHDVVGVTMSIWKEGNVFKGGTKNACYGPDEKKDIEETRKVCEQIGILFHVFDCSDKYEKIVLENFREEYVSGKTPNPCIWCNCMVKFATLPALAEKSGIKFDKFVTGHYARVEFDYGSKRYLIKTAADEKKDQTYFLYRLTQKQLSRVLFPLGTYHKSEVKKIAQENGLHVFDKAESQDFYSGDYNELLQMKNKKGNIVDKAGKVLGEHEGIWNYTIGQRKGLGVAAGKPLYVVGLDGEKNEVIAGHEEDTFDTKLCAYNLNWIAFDNLTTELKVRAKIRSSQVSKSAFIRPYENDEVCVDFEEPQKAITPGQSIVFYSNDIVLGGGIIKKFRDAEHESI